MPSGSVGANLIELEAAPTPGDARHGRPRWSDRRRGGPTGGRRSPSCSAGTRRSRRCSTPPSQRGARGRRVPASKVTTLTELLLGPSVALSDGSIALAGRDLLSHSRAIVRVTPDELLGHMADGYREVRDVVVDVGRAWDELLPRVRVARARAERAGRADRRRRAHGDGTAGRLDHGARRAVPRLATDPLSVDAAPLERIEHELSRLAHERAAVDELRRTMAAGAAAQRARLDQLERSSTRRRLQHRETARRGRRHGRRAGRRRRAVGRTRPDRGRSPGWRWDGRVERAGPVAQAVERRPTARCGTAAADRALLEDRRQLRGLLDAYIAKAERSDASRRRQWASSSPRLQDELYQAPTDLDHATELLSQVQAALSAPRRRCGP